MSKKAGRESRDSYPDPGKRVSLDDLALEMLDEEVNKGISSIAVEVVITEQDKHIRVEVSLTNTALFWLISAFTSGGGVYLLIHLT